MFEQAIKNVMQVDEGSFWFTKNDLCGLQMRHDLIPLIHINNSCGPFAHIICPESWTRQRRQCVRFHLQLQTAMIQQITLFHRLTACKRKNQWVFVRLYEDEKGH